MKTVNRATRNKFRPRLESLDERALPSVVVTTEDNGDNSAPTPGSLRAAIIAANATPAADTITFAIKPFDAGHVYYKIDSEVGQVSLDNVLHTTADDDADILDIDPDWAHSWWIIRPPAPLPEIKYPLTIEGYTQSGAVQNSLPVGSDAILRIELDGELAGPANGLVAHSAVTVRGLLINRFAASGLVGGSGIWLDRSGTDSVIQGNIIGLDVSGTVDGIGNTVAGLRTTNAGAQVGGTDPKARNTISGNTLGILLNNGGGDYHPLIQGNYIGTNLAGNQDRGNSSSGISILSAPGTIVGGSGQGAGNVISGNDTGVWLNGTSRHVLPGGFSCAVQGNIIGLDASGQAPLGNTNGVEIRSNFNLIGGLTPTPGRGAGNVISGNTQNGISVKRDRDRVPIAPPVEGTVVQGNIIGLDANGFATIGNGLSGFRTADAGALVGGVAREARNVISANQHGVLLSNSGSDYHTFIQGNYIGTDVSGNLDRGNVQAGVNVGSAPWTLVGGGAPGARNVISGNGTGVFIAGISHPRIGGLYNCVVQGNIIGLNATGTQPLGNNTGVLATNGFNLIGGDDLARRNIISGNLGNGVHIFQLNAPYPAVRNQVINNCIGTDLTGTRPFGNGLDGVLVADGAKYTVIRDNGILFNGRDGISLVNALNNTIQDNDSDRNVRDGLRIDDRSTGNRVLENWLVDNGGFDAHDDSTGVGTALTANSWVMNAGCTESRLGLLWVIVPCP